MGKSAATGLDLGDEHLMARIAGAVWALIAALALLAAIEPMRAAGTNVAATAALGLGAALVAGSVRLMPGRRRTRRLCELLLVLAAFYLGAVAYAAGDGRADLMLPLVFVMALSAYFFPWRRSVAHLIVTQATIGGYLLVSGGVDGSYVASLDAAVMGIWAMMLVLRRYHSEREGRIRAAYDVLDSETGLLSPCGLDQALDAELSRAARHARPLALIYLEVESQELSTIPIEKSRRAAATLAKTVVSRIRTEDRAARLDRFKFAVLAVETGESGACAMAEELSEQVGKRMQAIGYQPDNFSVAAGWADLQYDELPKEELMKSADAALAAAILAKEGISFPPAGDPLRPERLAPLRGA